MPLKQAILASAVLLLTTAAGAMLATSGCGSSDDRATTRTPDAIGTEAVFDAAGTGDLAAVSASDTRVGEEIVLKGSEWTNSDEPVGFILLTQEQTEGLFNRDRVVNLGTAVPREDGAVSFRFRLAGSYETPSGQQVHIEAGQQWYVMASQKTELGPGRSGSHGAAAGPLTVTSGGSP